LSPPHLISNSSHLYVFFLFFLILPQPPISTLFPYTTLFRSQTRGLAPRRFLLPLTIRRFPQKRIPFRWGSGVLGLRSRKPGRLQDRKSTRLNSSHVSISYAVFCLKKKKKK